MYTSPYRFFSIVKTLEETCKSPENNPPQKKPKKPAKTRKKPTKKPLGVSLGSGHHRQETGVHAIRSIVFPRA